MRLGYDFRIGDRDAGTFVVTDDGAELRQRVSFLTDEGDRYENAYAVRYASDRVLAFSVGNGDWVDCAGLPPDHAPTCAYPLLIRRGVTRYVAIDEESGARTPRDLEHLSDRVVERQNGAQVRAFDLRDGVIVRIDWGGAISTLRSSTES
jgi:hypothetical protein